MLKISGTKLIKSRKGVVGVDGGNKKDHRDKTESIDRYKVGDNEVGDKIDKEIGKNQKMSKSKKLSKSKKR